MHSISAAGHKRCQWKCKKECANCQALCNKHRKSDFYLPRCFPQRNVICKRSIRDASPFISKLNIIHLWCSSCQIWCEDELTWQQNKMSIINLFLQMNKDCIFLGVFMNNVFDIALHFILLGDSDITFFAKYKHSITHKLLLTVQSTLPKVESIGTEEIASTYRKFDFMWGQNNRKSRKRDLKRTSTLGDYSTYVNSI